MARRHRLIRLARHFLSECRPPVEDVVAAVSGGPDSVALLRALAEIVPGQVVVAHVNHGLRGADSDGDEEFVRELVAKLAATSRVSFKVYRVAAEQQSEPGNLEARGRRLRYDWLASVADACGIPWVATGHTADDQAETVLFRLLRGTGLDGLRGIAPCRTLTRQASAIRHSPA